MAMQCNNVILLRWEPTLQWRWATTLTIASTPCSCSPSYVQYNPSSFSTAKKTSPFLSIATTSAWYSSKEATWNLFPPISTSPTPYPTPSLLSVIFLITSTTLTKKTYSAISMRSVTIPIYSPAPSSLMTTEGCGRTFSWRKTRSATCPFRISTKFSSPLWSTTLSIPTPREHFPTRASTWTSPLSSMWLYPPPTILWESGSSTSTPLSYSSTRSSLPP